MGEYNSKDKFISLAELGSKIEQVLERSFGILNFWIVAEIASINVRKGHCYLTLIDKEKMQPEIKAEMKGLIWKDKFNQINTRFKDKTGFDLKENIFILFSATVKYNTRFGMSLMIEDIEPQFTIGLLLQEREKTILRLKQTGIYELNKRRAFPTVPQRIAVISASDSRGYEDFENNLINNPYHYKFYLKLYSSLLQGDKAAEDIRGKLIEIYKTIKDFDIVVIVRGGGGPVNLTCFNTFRLAEAVARFPLPVITGIGHTANISITDEIAYNNRSTPTDVANFIISAVNAYDQNILGLFEKIINTYSRISSDSFHKLELSSRNLYHMTEKILMNNYSYLSDIRNLLNNINRKIISKEESRCNIIHQNLINSYANIINSQNSINKSQSIMLCFHSKKMIEIQISIMNNLKEKIDILDPKNTLKRGYSITRLNGKSVKSTNKLKKGDVLSTELYKGKIESGIIEIRN